jgi:hypothetical protein
MVLTELDIDRIILSSQHTPGLGSHHGIRLEDISLVGGTTTKTAMFDLEPRATADYNYFRIGTPEDKDLLTIRENGNVGIGTNDAQTTLDVRGTGYFSERLGIGTAEPAGIFHIQDGDSQENVFLVSENGNVGIGVQNPEHKLTVSGTIAACEVLIDEDEWCDYVFEDDYMLMPLSELEQYLIANKHLPDIPSESEIKEVGYVNVGEMQKLHMKKIEELTLYIIELKKEIDALKEQVNYE